jgi:hypothetical protein
MWLIIGTRHVTECPHIKACHNAHTSRHVTMPTDQGMSQCPHIKACHRMPTAQGVSQNVHTSRHVTECPHINACRRMPTCAHHLQQWFFTFSILSTPPFLFPPFSSLFFISFEDSFLNEETVSMLLVTYLCKWVHCPLYVDRITSQLQSSSKKKRKIALQLCNIFRILNIHIALNKQLGKKKRQT